MKTRVISMVYHTTYALGFTGFFIGLIEITAMINPHYLPLVH
jgi:hypothetical protein